MVQGCLIKQHAKITQSLAAIEEAGIELLLRNPDAAMSEIALAAGVGRATLYRHYESREVLIQALARKCLDETDVLIEPIKQKGLRGQAAIEATIDVLMPMASRYRFLMGLSAITSRDAVTKQIYERQLRELSELVAQAQEGGEISGDLATVWVVSVFDAMLNSAWQLVELGKLSVDEATRAFKTSFFSGCQ